MQGDQFDADFETLVQTKYRIDAAETVTESAGLKAISSVFISYQVI